MAKRVKLETNEDSHIFELYECTVCLESMLNKQPRILPCGHTFCTPCIISLVATGTSMVCPKCRGVLDYQLEVWHIYRSIQTFVR